MAAEGPRRRRRPRSVRARTTIVATAAVGLALSVAAISLVLLLRRSLVAHLDEVAEIQAQDIAALAGQGALPPTLAGGPDQDDLAQVVTDADGVVAASPGVDRSRALVAFRPGGVKPIARTVEHLAGGDGGSYRVYALRAASPTGPVTVYVANSMDPVTEPTAFLRGALAVGAPVLLVVVALTTWAGVGRALRPVEAIRSRVADITARSIERRVPVPATSDEISRLAETMNTMLDRLDASAAGQRRFVADASHELRTPLASLRALLEVAAQHPASTDWAAAVPDLLADTARIELLVRDLLFLARADEGAPRPPLVPLDLDDIVLAEAARVRAGSRVAVDTSGVSAAAIQGRRQDMTRAVRNLLDNAVRHASSSVELELSSDETEVVLVVSDDGPGIPPADRQRVFARFVRLDDSRARDSGGTGLGLAITKEIVAGHGGTITVADAPQGACFVIRLPFA